MSAPASSSEKQSAFTQASTIPGASSGWVIDRRHRITLPVIGRATGVENVTYAFGHGHLGLTFGPITGRLIAELTAGKPASLDLHPYRVDRF